MTRQVNRRAVMRAILRRGAISRVDVAREAGVSKPTTNAIVQDLVEEGWVVEVGTQTGGVGRSATLFDIEPRAALTIGVDLGGPRPAWPSPT